MTLKCIFNELNAHTCRQSESRIPLGASASSQKPHGCHGHQYRCHAGSACWLRAKHICLCRKKTISPSSMPLRLRDTLLSLQFRAKFWFCSCFPLQELCRATPSAKCSLFSRRRQEAQAAAPGAYRPRAGAMCLRLTAFLLDFLCALVHIFSKSIIWLVRLQPQRQELPAVKCCWIPNRTCFPRFSLIFTVALWVGSSHPWLRLTLRFTEVGHPQNSKEQQQRHRSGCPIHPSSLPAHPARGRRGRAQHAVVACELSPGPSRPPPWPSSLSGHGTG